jgi:hypothetical protein
MVPEGLKKTKSAYMRLESRSPIPLTIAVVLLGRCRICRHEKKQ